MDLISVVVPIYNSEKFLETCILSILKQTYKNIELILIDDGSIDGSSLICKKYLKKDLRVKYIKNTNSGVSVARNTGIENSKGKYICFIDSDDIIERNYIETLHNIILEKKVDVVYCNYKLIYGKKIVKKESRIKEGRYSFYDVEKNIIDDGTITGILFGSACTALYNLDLIKNIGLKFNSKIKRNEDGLFNLCFIQKMNRLYVTSYSGYLYRQWKSPKSKLISWNKELDKATEQIKICCKNVSNLEEQLKSRYISVIFWNILGIVSIDSNIYNIYIELKKILYQHSFEEEYQFLNFEKINKKKLFLINLLRKKYIFTFILIMRYLYPIISKIVKH